MPTDRRWIIGLSIGSLWLIVAGGVFTVWSLAGINTASSVRALPGALAAWFSLLAVGAMVMRRAIQLPKPLLPAPRDRSLAWRFALVVAAEAIGFGIVNPVGAATGHVLMLPSLNLIIVGLHFLPLGSLFRVPRYYALGVMFCIIPLCTLLFVSPDAYVGAVPAWYVVPSMACGVVSAAFGAAGLAEVRRCLVADPNPVVRTRGFAQ